MPEPVKESLRVVIIAKSSRDQLNLKSILESNDLIVVQDAEFIKSLSEPADKNIADVLLVNLDESDEHSVDVLDQIMEKTNVPVLFSDSSDAANHFSQEANAWGRRLTDKLIELGSTQSRGRVVEQIRSADTEISGRERLSANDASVEGPASLNAGESSLLADQASTQAADDEIDLSKYERKIAEYQRQREQSLQAVPTKPLNKTEFKEIDNQKAKSSLAELKKISARQVVGHGLEAVNTEAAQCVWVLGASIGGPQAVEAFLTALPDNLPIAFILVQHIGSGFVPLLAEQLDRKCKLSVNEPRSGRLLRNNQVVVSPVNQRVSFDKKGHVILKPLIQKTTYSPSIDGALLEVADAYGAKAGAIIFSGMGNDGVQGVQAIKQEKGTVWAQDAGSCVISAMADCARGTGCVDFSGSPTQLARRLVRYLDDIG